MKPAAAFQATYSDWKLIRSRKVVQIVLELPLEAADQAYAVLGGMPNPASETWCGVARLNQQTGSTTERSTATTQTVTAPEPSQTATPARSRSWDLIPYPQQAGILCNDAKFQRFINEIRGFHHGEAIDYIKMVCEIRSRSEIKPNTQAAKRWELIVSSFRAWNQAPAHGAA